MSMSLAKRSMAKILLGLAWLLVAGVVSAQDSTAPLYDVELIIFRNLGSQPTPEDWGLEENLANRGKSGTAEESGGFAERLALNADALNVQPLSPDQFKLTSIAANLRANRNYRLLSHIAWTQATVPLRSNSITALTPMLDSASAVSGSAKLSRGASLHLTLDLRLSDASGMHYVLQETRQIKPGEKYYFDHPYVGVIATVTSAAARRP